jgi:uncharacterized protein YraI
MNWISRTAIAAAGVAASVSLPAAANAAVAAYATGNVNMRTCGSTSCPRITTIPAGAPVTIYGCTGGYGWCDTQYGGTRGWVSGNYLQAVAPGYTYAQPVPAIGALLGISILGAAIASQPYYYGYGYGYPYPVYRYPRYPRYPNARYPRYARPPYGRVQPGWRGAPPDMPMRSGRGGGAR